MQSDQFYPGQKARILEDTEVSGYTDGDLDQEFSVLLRTGTLVEVIGEPIPAGDQDNASEEMIIPISFTDSNGIVRQVLAEQHELSLQVRLN